MNRRQFSFGALAIGLLGQSRTVTAQTPQASPAALGGVPQVQPEASPSDPGAYIGALLGHPEAPARMLVYSDTQCQYCKEFYLDWLPSLITDYIEPKALLLEYRDHPIGGRGGLSAVVNTSSFEAQGLLAAGEQNAYFEMLDAMMQRTDVYSADVIASVTALADEIGIDADAVANRLEEQWFVPVLHAAVQDGRRRGITAVPSFQLGPVDDRDAVLTAPLIDLPFAGYDALRKDIDEALARIS